MYFSRYFIYANSPDQDPNDDPPPPPSEETETIEGDWDKRSEDEPSDDRK